MKIEDFSYIRCNYCKTIRILPIPYEGNYTLLSEMCLGYNEINECCSNPDNAYCGIYFGLEKGYIELSDLPLVIRKEFPLEVTYELVDSKHSLIINKHNGDVVTISVKNNIVSMDYNDGNRPRILDILVD